MCLMTLAACNGGLAELWRAPNKPQRIKPAPVVSMIAGRMGLLLSDAVPRQVAPTSGERVNVAESAPLGGGLWLVRTRVPLQRSAQTLRLTDGSLLEQRMIDQAVMDAPKAVLGLLLDADLTILEDQQGKGRKGQVVGCDGDPVPTPFALRVCLALAAHRGSARIDIKAVVPAGVRGLQEDAGSPLVDAQQRVDAGPATMKGDGGLRP